MKIQTICIIDDDPIFVYGTKVLLNYNCSFGSNIMVHEDGKEALENLVAMVNSGEELPDILFLDLNMPVMDGWEFLDEFTKLPLDKYPMIYIVSSSIDSNDIEKANEYSMVKDFIAKPLSDKVLVDLFKEIEAEDASNSSAK